MDWAVIIAAVIAFGSSIITLVSSRKSMGKTEEFNQKLGLLQAYSQDKQRIVETIGAQRIVWINNVREQFVNFNSDVQKLSFNKDRVKLENQDTNKLSEYIVELSEDLLKTIYNVNLYLNPNEVYSKAILSMMISIRTGVLKNQITSKDFDSHLKKLMFTQNVILKSEWKRVKEETDKGVFIKEDRVNEIIDEVAKNLNEDIHEFILKNYNQGA